MIEHAFLPLSGSSTWGECAAFPTMNALFPEPDTEDSILGIETHWMINRRLTVGLGECPVGSKTPQGLIVTDEMHECADIFVAEIARICHKHNVQAGELFYEYRVKATSIHPTHAWGTADAFVYIPRLNILYVLDYKHGHGFVEVVRNKQLTSYACGFMDQHGINGEQDQKLRVIFVIVQPRCYHAEGSVRRWECMASDLRADINHLSEQAHKALAPSPQAVTGNHCRYCPGRHACRPNRHASMAAIDYANNAPIEHLTEEGLSFELFIIKRALSVLESRNTALIEDARKRMREGKRIPGYTMQPGQARTKWSDPAVVAELQRQNPEVDLQKPDPWCTPTQAIKRGIDESVIKQYSVTPPTGMKVVEEDINSITRLIQND